MWGRVAEWSNALALKARVPLREPWVRIPPFPPSYGLAFQPFKETKRKNPATHPST